MNYQLVKLSLFFKILKNYQYIVCIDCFNMKTMFRVLKMFSKQIKFVSRKYLRYFLLSHNVKIQKGALSNFIYYTNSISDVVALVNQCINNDLWFISFVDLKFCVCFGCSWFYISRYFNKFYNISGVIFLFIQFLIVPRLLNLLKFKNKWLH